MDFDKDPTLQEWTREQPLSVLALDSADRAVLRIAATGDSHIFPTSGFRVLKEGVSGEEYQEEGIWAMTPYRPDFAYIERGA
ncbi:hypothetical protein GEV33_011720 [Tenebrio molitor]|uniref:Uncharacterized protein n=1 Tax=Tenebrio molitor TaxID=7067 RepID=A0A8J6LFN7_TENMO|nr:hypothetical protein GEV33_011720 [Tenebrio molitor]